jgi:hypothetical protein
LKGVVLASGAIANDGPCVPYYSIKCHTVSKPAPGDLVIVLPDDEASLADASIYREQKELLYIYEPRPPIPESWYSLVGSLLVAAPLYKQRARPDRWMDGSVTIWR